MLLWIAFALLTAAVLAWVLAPLARPASASAAQAADEIGVRAVYRDQLSEIEAERAAGLIGTAEAEAAKVEVSRRLLASAARAAATAGAPAAPARVRHEHLMLATAVAVPLLTLVLYLAHGSPGMPSGSLSARTEDVREMAKVAGMIAEVEKRLREAPDDGKGWEVIAPVYLKLGRYADAATAYANTVRLQGESVKLLAGLAEASILAKDGIVTEEARAAYERILKLEPGRVEARFWLALGKEQDGRLADALADYSVLLKEAPSEAPYRPALKKRIADVAARIVPGTQPAPEAKSTAKAPSGPTADDIEAAAKLSPEERAAMIAGMVEGLAERLKRDGKDLPGWKRLIQSYKALDRREEARAALAAARRQFEGDAGALADLSQLAEKLGLGS
jgi:cytochrome c-type biogenesis protein CcmH